MYHPPQQNAWDVGATASKPTRSTTASRGNVDSHTWNRGSTTALGAGTEHPPHRIGTLTCRANAESQRLASDDRHPRRRREVVRCEVRGLQQLRSQPPTCVLGHLLRMLPRRLTLFPRLARLHLPGVRRHGLSHSERHELLQALRLQCGTLQLSHQRQKALRTRARNCLEKQRVLVAVMHHRPEPRVLEAEASRRGRKRRQGPPNGPRTTSGGQCACYTQPMRGLYGGLCDDSTFAFGTLPQRNCWRS